MIQMQVHIKSPYLIFLGDEPGRSHAKTGVGIAHWRPELCLAQHRLPGSGVDLGIPDMTPAEAKAGGAATMIWGVASVGGGIPDHWVPRQVVRELGSPITGTSANRSGMPALTSAEDVRMQLGGDIDYVVDAGRSMGGVASTIVDVSGATPVVLRVGAVSIQEIEDACGTAVAAVGTR